MIDFSSFKQLSIGGVLLKKLFVNGVQVFGYTNQIQPYLLSSDGYILKDSNGIYLIPKDCTEVIIDNVLLSSDGYILKDSNGIYLIIKESE